MIGATDVIATVTFGSQRYEIAWPWDPDLEPGMKRNPWLGVVRKNGEDASETFPCGRAGKYSRASEVVVEALQEIGHLLEVQA